MEVIYGASAAIVVAIVAWLIYLAFGDHRDERVYRIRVVTTGTTDGNSVSEREYLAQQRTVLGWSTIRSCGTMVMAEAVIARTAAESKQEQQVTYYDEDGKRILFR